MNKVIISGNVVAKPEVRYSQGESPLAIARYRIASRRRFKREGEQDADFISCVAFGKSAEFAEKYFDKGSKIIVEGRIQTGSWTNKEGQKVYTTEVVVENQEFSESKKAAEGNAAPAAPAGTPAPAPAHASGDSDFMNIPDGIDEELPFN